MNFPAEEKRSDTIEDGHFDFTRDAVNPNEFEESTELRTIHFNSKALTIGRAAFKKNSNLNSVTFDKDTTLTRLEPFAFDRTPNLKNIVLPPLARIEMSAFQNSGLESVTFPEELVAIEGMAFTNCNKLKNVSLRSKVKSIGTAAFEECSNLNTVVLSESLEVLGNNVFTNCLSLKKVILPSKVKSLGVAAFEGCASLRTVILPESLVVIGNNAFNKCPSLMYICIDSKNAEEIQRIKNLLPANLQDKVISQEQHQKLHMYKELVMAGNIKSLPQLPFHHQSMLYQFFSTEANEKGELGDPELLKEIMKFV